MGLAELHKEIISSYRYPLHNDTEIIIMKILKVCKSYSDLRSGKLTMRKLCKLTEEDSRLERLIRQIYDENKEIYDKLISDCNLKIINKDKIHIREYFRRKLYKGGKVTYTQLFEALNLPKPNRRPRNGTYYHTLRTFAVDIKNELTKHKLYKLWDDYKKANYKLPEPTYAYVSEKLKVSKQLLENNNILMSNIRKQYFEYNKVIDDHIIKIKQRKTQSKYHKKKIKNKKKLLQNNIIKSRTQMIYTKANKTPNKYLNVTYSQFKEHMDKQLKPDMNWDNYGRGKLWGIYYKIHPRNAKSKKQVLELNKIDNLYPEYYRNIHKDRFNNSIYKKSKI